MADNNCRHYFHVEMGTNNDAFREAGVGVEVARLLREAADAVEDGKRNGTLVDGNGNHVGRFWSATGPVEEVR